MAKTLRALALTVIGTFAGLWLGCFVREQLTGKRAQWLRFEYVDAEGRRFSSMPVSTKLYPALLIARLGQPRWLFGAFGGVATGLLVDDRHEASLLRWILARTPGNTGLPEAEPSGAEGRTNRS